MKRIIHFILSLTLFSISCQVLTPKAAEPETMHIGQVKPSGVSCQTNPWTQANNNGLRINIMGENVPYTGFVYELKDGVLFQYLFKDGIQIAWNTIDVTTDGLIEVNGTIPGLPYEGELVNVRFTIYLLVCNEALYYTDFMKEAMP